MSVLSKKQCREIYDEKRRLISPNQLRSFSEKISEILFTNFNLEQKTISLFLPIEQKKEINTYIILEKALDLNAIICIPKTNFATCELKHYLYQGPEQLEISKYNIPEPKYGKVISPKNIQYAIVPLLTFDKQGFRVGYGKGFYDHFLSKCDANTVFIGLSLFEGIDQIEDLHSSDVPLHYVITPNEKIKF